MAKYKVELDDGRKFAIEADTQPTNEEVMQHLGQKQATQAPMDISQAKQITDPSLGIEQGRLTGMERLSGGFRTESDLKKTRDIQAGALGLTKGTPLEPVGFNLANLLDLPNDIFADMVGPAMPAIGQIFGEGGGAAVGSLIAPGAGTAGGFIAGGAVGSGLGELARQEIGRQVFKFEPGPADERSKKILFETAIGAAGSAGGIALNSITKGVSKLIGKTKLGILKSVDKATKKGTFDSTVRVFNNITGSRNPNAVTYALQQSKIRTPQFPKGDNFFLNSKLGKQEHIVKFANNLFGIDDMGDNAKRIAGTKKGGDKAIKELYRKYLGIDHDITDTMIKQGSRIKQFSNPNKILQISKNISDDTTKIFDDVGESIQTARANLAKKAGNLDLEKIPGVNLPQANTILADELTAKGFLMPQGNGRFTINPDFDITSTGKEQTKLFGNLMKKFFKEDSGFDVLRQKTQGIKGEELATLLNQVGTKTNKIYNVNNTMKFRDFDSVMRAVNSQINGSEFAKLGELSPALAQYLRAIREIPVKVGQSIGDDSIALFTREFSELKEVLGPLQVATRTGDIKPVQNLLTKLSDIKADPATKAIGDKIDKTLFRRLGKGFMDDLDALKAASKIENLKAKPLELSDRLDKFIRDADAIFTGESSFERIMADNIDPFLPDSLKIVPTAKRHVAAKELHNGAISLLRARFLMNALLGGFVVGGPVGSAFGITAGMALQNPILLRKLIQVAGRIPKTQLAKGVAKGTARSIPAKGTSEIISQLLRMGISKE